MTRGSHGRRTGYGGTRSDTGTSICGVTYKQHEGRTGLGDKGLSPSAAGDPYQSCGAPQPVCTAGKTSRTLVPAAAVLRPDSDAAAKGIGGPAGQGLWLTRGALRSPRQEALLAPEPRIFTHEGLAGR